MPQDDSRVSVLENKVLTVQTDLERLRKHIGELLTFKSQIEGGVAMSKWMLGFVGLSNIVLIVKLFMR